MDLILTGESGVLGSEEEKIIIPAIQKSKELDNILVWTHFRTVFLFKSNLNKFDVILSMYHDQGLTPFKTLSFFDGVNYTSGLEIIRTSPVRNCVRYRRKKHRK